MARSGPAKWIVLAIAFAFIAVYVFLSFNKNESWYLPVLILTLIVFGVYMKIRKNLSK